VGRTSPTLNDGRTALALTATHGPSQHRAMSGTTHLPVFEPADPVCFVSPHLDDVVMSCGHYLTAHPGMTVLTVLAGAPARRVHAGWNAKTTGQRYAPDALQARRAEDVQALNTVGARPVWLDGLDAEYLVIRRDATATNLAARAARALVARRLAWMRARRPEGQQVTPALHDALAALRPNSVVAPLGLHHPDHAAVSNACLRLAAQAPWRCYLYEDVPYAHAFPGERRRRLRQLERRVMLRALAPVPAVDDRKQRAARCYDSQLEHLRTGLPRLDEALAEPERYWTVELGTDRGRGSS